MLYYVTIRTLALRRHMILASCADVLWARRTLLFLAGKERATSLRLVEIYRQIGGCDPLPWASRLVVVVELVCLDDPESYDSGGLCFQ